MESYKELLEQQAELTRKIEEARKRELADAIAEVRAVVTKYELVPRDIFTPRQLNPTGTRASTKGTKVAPKYRNPLTGQTWTGRGKAPKWIEGKDRTQFAI